MSKLQIICYIIGVSQLALGGLYLFAPAFFIGWQGMEIPAEALNYPLGMLAARFFVYGVGMFVIARAPAQHLFWLNGMIAIQAIDLAVGVFYTATGAVAIADSLVPMFDAALFIGLILWVRPKADAQVVTA